MAALIETIAVMDKSGKAVSTSKQLVNIYKEAKAAYRERKAEVIAGRNHSAPVTPTRRTLREAPHHDNHSASSRSHSGCRHDHQRPPLERRSTSGSYKKSDAGSIYPSSHHRHSGDIGSPRSPSFQQQALTRRHSARDDEYDFPRPGQLQKRAMTSPMTSSKHDDIDMDLAYGPIPPPLPVARQGGEAEMKGLIQTVKSLLEEADCLQYSASAIIARLQKNPDAMAAVALTLAEISNIARKMAPGALTAMRGSSPAVFSLLSSPQFLIAGGLAVGVTIVAFGGFKIIKKLQAKNAMAFEGMDEMVEIGGYVNRIDNWRRGIAEEEEHSVATSADGEFITPAALAMSRMNLNDERKSEVRRKSAGSENRKSSTITSSRGSGKSSRSSSRDCSKGSSKAGSLRGSTREKNERKISRPSPLRLMLTTGSTTS